MTDIQHPLVPVIADATTAILFIVKALKNQPGFDRDSFEKEIQHYIDNINDQTGVGKDILRKALV